MDIYSYRRDVITTVGGLDLAGFTVEAADGSIGKIDEATYDESSSCLVVDTGFWIFGKKRLIPAGTVRRIDTDARVVHVAMTKDEIKAAPDFDEQRHRNDERGYHDEMGLYYESLGIDRDPQ